MILFRGAATEATTASPGALAQSAPPGYRQRARLEEDQFEVAEPRPETCPILASQFHWNLNARAVESLSEEELAQVYRLFRFYDSSTVGDTLPSINCRRFLQVLRDGGVLATSAGLPAARGCALSRDGASSDPRACLDVSAVEQIFAEAVMDKLRTYLDADGQPVLTFHLFCGAIMNCALAICPMHRSQPEIALMKLLASVDRYAEERQREPRRQNSLLQHFPKERVIWKVVVKLLGGEHDGAICCSVELTLPQRHVEESSGTFYLNALHEVLERSQVLPVQPDSESALLMLKKRVQLRLSEGFVLHPLEQLERVDRVLSQVRQHNPHYQSPLRASPPPGTSRPSLLTPVTSSPHKTGASERNVRSLDRAGTCGRQGSASDLLVQLSDSSTNQHLKKKKSAILHRGGSIAVPQAGSVENQGSSQRIPTETVNSSLDWIHSVNKPSPLKQLHHQHAHKALKPHHGVPLILFMHPL